MKLLFGLLSFFLYFNTTTTTVAVETTNTTPVEFQDDSYTLNLSKKALLKWKVGQQCGAYYAQDATVGEFKVKCTGIASRTIKGADFDAETKTVLGSLNAGDSVVLFDVKTTSGKSLPSITIAVK